MAGEHQASRKQRRYAATTDAMQLATYGERGMLLSAYQVPLVPCLTFISIFSPCFPAVTLAMAGWAQAFTLHYGSQICGMDLVISIGSIVSFIIDLLEIDPRSDAFGQRVCLDGRLEGG